MSSSSFSPVRNKGSEVHRLKCCDFAGWDSVEQFTLGAVKGSAPLKDKQPSRGSDSGSDSTEKQVYNVKEGQKDCEVLKEKTHCPSVRKEERELDIPPGERLAVVVACQAK